MKIAFLLSDYPVQSETFVLRQISGLINRGHDVTVITGKFNTAIDNPFAGKVTLRLIRPRALGAQWTDAAFGTVKVLRSLQQSKKLAKAAFSRMPSSIADVVLGNGQNFGKFDAIVAHFGPSGVRAMYLRKMGYLDGPIATIFHGIDITEKKLLKKYLPHYMRLFQETEAMLPVSALWKDRLASWGAPLGKLHVLRMGIDADKFKLNTRSSEPHRPLRVLTTARFVEKKGLEYAIEGVCAAVSDVHLSIIGFGPLEEKLRAAATKCDTRISFVGRCSHAKVLERLREADVFLLPSVTAANGDMEGIPVSIMEAMALGVTVVATHHSGIPELIQDGKEGILVPERDPQKIAAALDAIAQGKYDLPSMRKAARLKVKTMFDNDKLEAELETFLKGLVPQ